MAGTGLSPGRMAWGAAYAAAEVGGLAWQAPGAVRMLEHGTDWFVMDTVLIRAAAVASALVVTFIPLRIAGLPMLSLRDPVPMALCWFLMSAAVALTAGPLPEGRVTAWVLDSGYRKCPSGAADGHPRASTARVFARRDAACP